MGELDQRLVERYAELLAPAFVEGLTQPIPELAADGEIIIKCIEAELAVTGLVKSIEWDNTTLPPHQLIKPGSDNYSPDNEYVNPREFAVRLVNFAFEDARRIIEFGDAFLKAKGIEDNRDDIFKRSKSLLTVAKLPDKSKQRLFQSIEFADIRESLSNVPQYEGGPFVLSDNSKQIPMIEWNPTLVAWINKHTKEAGGCPAYKMSVELVGGRKVNLLAYFWDRLVEHVYGSN
jgi:hypothetical protein